MRNFSEKSIFKALAFGTGHDYEANKTGVPHSSFPGDYAGYIEGSSRLLA